MKSRRRARQDRLVPLRKIVAIAEEDRGIGVKVDDEGPGVDGMSVVEVVQVGAPEIRYPSG